MLSTKAAAEALGIARTTLNYQCLRHGIRPRQKTINGRTHNSYAVKDVQRLRTILAVMRTRFK